MDDVMTGRDGVLFLVTSVHNILDHITGKIEIPTQSIENFGSNIRHRRKYCEDRGIAYRHVIYPDKTTVMRSYFPVQGTRSFSDRYKIHFDESVIDLARHLPDSNEHYLRTDTHLNFVGKVETTLTVVRSMNDVNEESARRLLMSSKGEAYEMLGDLGSKVSPVQREIHYRVVNRDTKNFNNQVGANDGLTIVQFNLRMLRNGLQNRLLIFGDSFAERSLRLFGHFYSEILFCRTRYFHDEIAFMYRPDHIITESAERYFSSVRLDQDSNRFNLLYGLRGHRYSDNTDFYKAYDAALNYGSDTYKRFIERLLRAT